MMQYLGASTWKQVLGKSRHTAQHRIPLSRSSNLLSFSFKLISVFNFFLSGSKFVSRFSLLQFSSCKTRVEGPGMSAISFVYVLRLLTFRPGTPDCHWRHSQPIATRVTKGHCITNFGYHIRKTTKSIVTTRQYPSSGTDLNFWRKLSKRDLTANDKRKSKP